MIHFSFSFNFSTCGLGAGRLLNIPPRTDFHLASEGTSEGAQAVL